MYGKYDLLNIMLDGITMGSRFTLVPNLFVPWLYRQDLQPCCDSQTGMVLSHSGMDSILSDLSLIFDIR